MGLLDSISYPIAKDGSTIKALSTGVAFHRDDGRMRMVVGPVGSGKSTMMAMEIFRRASRQLPQSDGVRRSRWAVIRGTYPQLKDTTIKTWLNLFPEHKYGKFYHAPPSNHLMSWEVEDKQGGVTKVECEVMFRALDRPEQISNLLSLELTGAWVNEVRDTPKPVLDALDSRIGRYPAVKEGGCTWRGIIMDTNPFDIDHYLYDLFEKNPPLGYRVWRQPQRENEHNLDANYYANMSHGKSEEWIKIYVKGEYGYICEGKIVYPEFNYNMHIASSPLLYSVYSPIYCGIDFGLTPAIVWTQINAEGQWLIIRELFADEVGKMGIERFGDEFLDLQKQLFPKQQDFRYFVDPAGFTRSQTDEKSCCDILNNKGVVTSPGRQDLTSRRESVAKRLTTLIGGKPALLIDPSCKQLIAGFMGKYYYPQTNTGLIMERPQKNIYSHIHDALQYCGTGIFGSYEGARKKKRVKKKRPNWITV